jgi:hypothetical protein
LAFFIGVFILGAVVVITHKETVLLSERLAALQRKESVSNRSRIAACKALEDLITGRCVDMDKHIETYQDINKKKIKNLCLSQDAMSGRIDDLFRSRNAANIRLDDLGTGCIQTNTRLDKWIKDLRHRIDVLRTMTEVLQLASVGLTVPPKVDPNASMAVDMNADEVSA